MAIIVNEKTKVIVQGITGRMGNRHTSEMFSYGTKIVAGISPGKGGEEVHGIPVYHTVTEALGDHQADVTIIFVPPPDVLEAVSESIYNGIKIVVIVTENVPVYDTMQIKQIAREENAVVIGPNSIGIISPGKTKLGIMPGSLYSPGSVGILSRTGSATHDFAAYLSKVGIGQSTCVDIGGDAVTGSGFIEMLKLWRQDSETKALVLIGEIGGRNEEEAAEYLRQDHYPIPVYAFIAGRQAPPGTQMGHAGAIIQGDRGTVQSKVGALSAAGVRVAVTPSELVGWLIDFASR